MLLVKATVCCIRSVAHSEYGAFAFTFVWCWPVALIQIVSAYEAGSASGENAHDLFISLCVVLCELETTAVNGNLWNERQLMALSNAPDHCVTCG